MGWGEEGGWGVGNEWEEWGWIELRGVITSVSMGGGGEYGYSRREVSYYSLSNKAQRYRGLLIVKNENENFGKGEPADGQSICSIRHIKPNHRSRYRRIPETRQMAP